MHSELNFIKDLISENIFKGKLLTWNEILFILEDYEYEQEKINDLYKWYLNITQLSFLNLKKQFEEIIIHSSEQICYLSNGSKSFTDSTISQEDLELAYLTFTLKHNIQWNFKKPFASFKVIIEEKEFRFTLIHKSTTANQKSKAFIRSISKNIFQLQLFSPFELEPIVKKFISDKKNILICGPTGSGKTSLLNSFLTYLPDDEHLIVIEDTEEIKTTQTHNTKLLANDLENKSMQDYIAYSMRMSPDRIILGEIRSKEVVPFIMALNTGHNGSVGTIHANNAVDSIHRLALLYCIYSNTNLSYELILKLITKNIEIIIYMESKKIVDICQIYGCDRENIIYESLFFQNSELNINVS